MNTHVYTIIALNAAADFIHILYGSFKWSAHPLSQGHSTSGGKLYNPNEQHPQALLVKE